LPDFLEHPAHQAAARLRIGVENEFVSHAILPIVNLRRFRTLMWPGCGGRDTEPPSIGDQAAVKSGSITRLSQGGQDIRIAQLAGDTGKRAELFTLLRVRQQQQRDHIDRLAVHGVEVDRLFQTHEHSEWLLYVTEARVRERHAAARSGRSELLAPLQRGKDHVRLKLDGERSASRKLFEQFLFVGERGVDSYIAC
jgi:hypothetical protein